MTELNGKRILVTGANGFIGSHLMELLAESEATILAGYHETVPVDSYGMEWEPLDVRDSLSVIEVLADFQPNYIVNLAASTGHTRTIEKTEHFVDVNFSGAYNILRAASRVCTSVERIILMGTSEEYGRVAGLPVTEDQRTHPLSAYGASKSAMTHFGRVYNQLFALPVVTLRPFYAYGPGQPAGSFLPALIRAITSGRDFAMTAGTQTRDFVFVSDVVRAITSALTAPRVNGEVFNVCTGVERSTKDVAEMVVALAGSSTRLLSGALPYRQDEVWRSCGSFEKAERLLNWRPEVDLEEGLSLMLEAQQEISAGYSE